MAKKNRKITKVVIDKLEEFSTFEEKKNHLLEYIGDVDTSDKRLSPLKITKMRAFRTGIRNCSTEAKLTEILWSSLLSGENMSVN